MPIGTGVFWGAMPSPNPLRVAWSIVRVLVTVRAPRPAGVGTPQFDDYGRILAEVAAGGTPTLVGAREKLEAVIEEMARLDPDRFDRDGALAYWINLYNAGGLALAGRAAAAGQDTVLRVPGGFGRPLVTVAGERLSLDAVEHAKVRRFGDPRIHSALVCGAVSCPTLREEPYEPDRLDAQLEDQMRAFLAAGGAVVDREEGVVRLARIFSWFRSDFTRPERMPTFLPTTRRRVLGALSRWLEPEVEAWVERAAPSVEFLPYDWGLRCTVG